MAKGLIRAAVVTPGGHHRFLSEDDEALEGRLNARAGGADLVSSKEAARLLGVSQQTLNRAVREGRVQPAAVTPGGHRRFAISELVESRRKAANAVGTRP
ncbi:MAG TPA: helix-turn-helix domain-containing protein [Candidatus Dormibacteraeota bacterium]|nr:helix-turn-helix domain-containing protein [Candidatus Dormibacteraeota bacterium]